MDDSLNCHCGSSNCCGFLGEGNDEAALNKKKKIENMKNKLKNKTKRKSKRCASTRKTITSPAVVETNDSMVKMMNIVGNNPVSQSSH